MIATPLDRYYANLDGGDFDAAADAFTADALYIRLARAPGEGLETIRGRDEIRAAFRLRGLQPLRHEPQTCLVDGNECLIEGRLTRAGVVDRVFLAAATLDASGLIARYLALGAPAGTVGA
jgi:hypothetical protein